MENKVLENRVDVNYKVKVGEHFVRTFKLAGSELDKLHDYNLGEERYANFIGSLDNAKTLAKLLNGSIIEVTTTRLVIRNEKEVKIND